MTDATQPALHEIEALIAALWGHALAIAEVERADSLPALGGSLLVASEVAAELRARLGRDVRTRHVLLAPSLGDLAALVHGAGPVPSAAPEPIPPVPRVPTSFGEDG